MRSIDEYIWLEPSYGDLEGVEGLFLSKVRASSYSIQGEGEIIAGFFPSYFFEGPRGGCNPYQCAGFFGTRIIGLGSSQPVLRV